MINSMSKAYRMFLPAKYAFDILKVKLFPLAKIFLLLHYSQINSLSLLLFFIFFIFSQLGISIDNPSYMYI